MKIERRSSRQASTWLKDFQSQVGPDNCDLTSESSPLQFFSLIFSEDTVENIIKWTNVRAKSRIDNANRRKQKKAIWRDLYLEEMNTFIGCILAMGIIKLPNFEMYWSKDTRLFTVSGISELISQQRFKDIYSSLCLRDSTFDTEDKLSKISPIVDAVIFHSQYYYRPEKELSLNEAMIPFNGRSNLKVYMPQKPIKYGLKAYMICEASTGFVINWFLHTGTLKKSESTITHKIVMKLVDGLEGEGHTIYMDRYYTGLPLFRDLKEMNIGACGTIMLNRIRAKESLVENIERLKDREISYFMSSDSLLISIWKDHKIVIVASNFHKPTEVEKEMRLRKKDRDEETEQDAKENVQVPQAISGYISYMRGVDNFDQLSCYYRPDIRTRRWYVKVFFHLLEISVINGYIIYKRICEIEKTQPMKHLCFRKEIIRGLIAGTRNERNIPSSVKKKVSSSQKVTSQVKEEEKQCNENILVNLAKTKFSFEKESQQSLFENSGRRKSNSNFLEEFSNDCIIQQIPLEQFKKTNRKACIVCKEKYKIEGVKKTVPLTSLWCIIHKIPVCKEICYDLHRHSTLQKKWKYT